MNVEYTYVEKFFSLFLFQFFLSQQSNIKRVFVAKSNNIVIWQTWIRLPVYVKVPKEGQTLIFGTLYCKFRNKTPWMCWRFAAGCWHSNEKRSSIDIEVNSRKMWYIFFCEKLKEKKTKFVFFLENLAQEQVTWLFQFDVSVNLARSGGLYLNWIRMIFIWTLG